MPWFHKTRRSVVNGWYSASTTPVGSHVNLLITVHAFAADTQLVGTAGMPEVSESYGCQNNWPQ